MQLVTILASDAMRFLIWWLKKCLISFTMTTTTLVTLLLLKRSQQIKIFDEICERTHPVSQSTNNLIQKIRRKNTLLQSINRTACIFRALATTNIFCWWCSRIIVSIFIKAPVSWVIFNGLSTLSKMFWQHFTLNYDKTSAPYTATNRSWILFGELCSFAKIVILFNF